MTDHDAGFLGDPPSDDCSSTKMKHPRVCTERDLRSVYLWFLYPVVRRGHRNLTRRFQYEGESVLGDHDRLINEEAMERERIDNERFFEHP